MRHIVRVLLCVLAASMAAPAIAAQVILNEYNAVSNTNKLDDADMFFGRINGNGGNWFELLVIEDQVDMRGWKLAWTEDEQVGDTGQTAAGTITLADALIWSGLRSGTIISFIETVDADGQGTFNTSTDLSYAPLSGDWSINVATRQEQAKGAAGVVSTVTNDGSPGDFSVGKSDWTLTIRNAAGQTVFGPAGEGSPTWAGEGISGTEGGKLEGLLGTPADPLTFADWQAVTPGHPDYDDTGNTSFGSLNHSYDPGTKVFTPVQDLGPLRSQVTPPQPDGDFNNDGLLTAADIDTLSTAVRMNSTDLQYDLNADQAVNDADREVWVNELKNTYFGDADLDGEFNSADFVAVFQEGQYEDNVPANSGWATGDWNGDAEFTSDDFVTAFQSGGYEFGTTPPGSRRGS